MLDSLDGDASAHERLLRAIAPLLRSFFARRVGADSADVEDLVQESLIAAHTRRGSFERARPFTPWLFSIARHKLMDHFRRARRYQQVDTLEELLVEEGFDRASNAAMDVERLLRLLPQKQARAIRDTKIAGLGVAEAAAAAGMTVSDVKVSVHRGMRALAGSAAIAAAR
ncbi:MAG TPA: sigma-70 family RNA polymerase sigma factor [Allosphingosinicella sp.]|jgi:RNA polymerase sigma-70 factor (ECF subfamily)